MLVHSVHATCGKVENQRIGEREGAGEGAGGAGSRNMGLYSLYVSRSNDCVAPVSSVQCLGECLARRMTSASGFDLCLFVLARMRCGWTNTF